MWPSPTTRETITTSPPVPDEPARRRFLATPIYLVAVVLLGAMAFVGNAPVFEALLPRDASSEAATDASLLAAGVVLFLLVLAHFFGASLSSLRGQRSASRESPGQRKQSSTEEVVRLVISGVGLCLVLAVLFEARVTMGQVASDRFAQDSARIAQLTTDVRPVELDSLQARAAAEREAGEAISNLRIPMLFLNMAIVLSAILAAFLHRGVAPRQSLSRRLSHES